MIYHIFILVFPSLDIPNKKYKIYLSVWRIINFSPRSHYFEAFCLRPTYQSECDKPFTAYCLTALSPYCPARPLSRKSLRFVDIIKLLNMVMAITPFLCLCLYLDPSHILFSLSFFLALNHVQSHDLFSLPPSSFDYFCHTASLTDFATLFSI